MDQRSGRGGRHLDRRDRRQRLVVDHDPAAGVLRYLAAGCNHGGHRFSDMAYLAGSERIHGDRERRIADIGEGEYGTGSLDHVLACDNAVNTGKLARPADIDADDAGMGKRAPDQRHVEYPPGVEVVDERAMPAHHPGRLDRGEL